MGTLLVGLVMVVGLVGVVVPVLPGTALVLAAGVAWAALVVDGGAGRWAVVGVMAALFAAGLVLKYALPGRRLSAELPRSTLLATAVGAGIGFVVLPPLGLLLGAVVATYAVGGPPRRVRGSGPRLDGAGAQGRRPGCARRAHRRRAHGRHVARRSGRHVTEEKTCVTCGRTITWRKKWARDWDAIRYCSDACRRSKPDGTDAALEQSVLELLDARTRGATICPSEAARAVGGDDWRPLMEPARAAARRLVAKGDVEITQGGRVVDGSTAKGPIRIRRTSSG